MALYFLWHTDETDKTDDNTDLFLLLADNQGKIKSDPLLSFYLSHPCAIENTKLFSFFPYGFKCFPLRKSALICVSMNHRLSYLLVREALLLEHFPLNKCKV